MSSQAEEFASQGVPALLRTAPDLSEMLENLNAMFEGGDRACHNVFHNSVQRADRIECLVELLPVEGKDEEFEVSVSFPSAKFFLC